MVYHDDGMAALRGHRGLKAAGILILFAAFMMALVIVPALRKAPGVMPEPRLPSMSHVPTAHDAPGK
jgi:hypothetical protein